ncbi:MAG: PAS domain-containing protein, partial [Thermoplasmatota archaeon]
MNGPEGEPALAGWLFAQSPAAMVVHDGTVVRAVNEAAAALLQRDVDELVGHPLAPLISEASRADVEARFQRSDESHFVGMLQRADGTEMPVRVTPRHVELNGESLRISVLDPLDVVKEDMGQLRDAMAREEELRRLKETSQFKTQILNTTAHELNTPLTPVRLQLHLLKTGAL